MIDQFHFIRPEMGLLIIPLGLLILWFKYQKHPLKDWHQQVDEELIPYVIDQRGEARSSRLLWHFIAALILVFSLAGPAWQKQPQPVFSQQNALIIALDLSRSMLAEDIKPNRLQRAKFIIQDILRAQSDNQFALIVFAGESFVVTPLSTDRQTLISQLQALSPDIMPNQGSNIASAISKAEQLQNNSEIKKARLLIITDALEQLNPEEIQSKKLDISLYALATSTGAPIPSDSKGFIKDRQGNIILSQLEQSIARQLQNNPKIRFRVFSNSDQDLQWLLPKQQASLKKDNKRNTTLWKDQGALFAWLLLPYLVLWFRKGIIFGLLLFVLPLPHAQAFELPSWLLNQNQKALRNYQQKNYPQAAKQFSDPAWQASSLYRAGKYQQAEKIWQTQQDANSLYNAGNAAAKNQQYQKAIDYYEKALKKQPDFADAKANLEAVKKFLQKQKKQQQKPTSQQKQKQQKKSQKKQEQKQQKSGNKKSDNKQAGKQQQSQSKAAQRKKDRQQKNKSKGSTQQQQNKKNKEKQKKQAMQKQKLPKDKKAEQEQKQNPSKPLQQRQLNKTEQWLQKIPDDPGGLLRRKFYYYSQQPKQQQNQQPW